MSITAKNKIVIFHNIITQGYYDNNEKDQVKNCSLWNTLSHHIGGRFVFAEGKKMISVSDIRSD